MALNKSLFIFNFDFMRLFVRNIGSFFLIFILYAISMYFINSMIMHAQRPELTGKQILIIGDSHPKFALDPELLGSAINISQTAEPYYVTYWKLKEVVQNSSVDIIMLGFAYHNLSAFNDKKLEDNYWASEMFRRTYTIEEFEELEGVEIDKISFYETKFKNMCLFPKHDHIHYIGGYENTDQNDFSDYESVIARHYYYNDKNVGVSNNSIRYLDSISTFCTKKDIELVLVSSPLQEEYLTRIPENFVKTYEKIKQKMKNKEVHVFDYGNVAFDDKYFLNSDHLNSKGAEAFTREIKRRLTPIKSNMRSRITAWKTAIHDSD